MNQVSTFILVSALVLSFFSFSAMTMPAKAQGQNQTQIEWITGELRVGNLTNFKYIANSNNSLITPPSIDVVIEGGLENTTLDQFKTFKNQSLSQIQNMTVIGNRTTTLANNTAFEIFMTGEDLGIPYTAIQTFTMIGNRAMTVMYIAESHEFETYLPYYYYMKDNI